MHVRTLGQGLEVSAIGLGAMGEVLALMVEGLSNHDIAGKLYVSQSTVKFHVSSILSKLAVTNRTEAVALAVKQKLV